MQFYERRAKEKRSISIVEKIGYQYINAVYKEFDRSEKDCLMRYTSVVIPASGKIHILEDHGPKFFMNRPDSIWYR